MDQTWETSHRRTIGQAFEPVLVEGFCAGRVSLWLPQLRSMPEYVHGVKLSPPLADHPGADLLQRWAATVLGGGSMLSKTALQVDRDEFRVFAKRAILSMYRATAAEIAELLSGEDWHTPVFEYMCGGERGRLHVQQDRAETADVGG